MKETFIYVDFTNPDSLAKFISLSGIEQQELQKTYLDHKFKGIMFSTTTGDVVLYFNEDSSVTAMSPILDIQYMSFDDINRIDEILKDELEKETSIDENNG